MATAAAKPRSNDIRYLWQSMPTNVFLRVCFKLCGIVAIVGQQAGHWIDAATDRLQHRGPDGRGVWVSTARPVALGHRRLSIIDTSTGGQQPMISNDERWVISFNGEIYNYRELRQRLSDVPFRSNSDTEVLLETIADRGLVSALDASNGMFAFVVYDRLRNELHFACDRLGEKPLYYGKVANHFMLASELKSIRSTPSFDAPIDRNALALYLRYNCIPAPHTIYEGIKKLEPGTWCTVSFADGPSPVVGEPVIYWSMHQVAMTGRENPFTGNDEQAIAMLEEQLSESVASRMVADVPLGAFLSGGYDSTAVVGTMQRLSPDPVKTFSIGMGEIGYDEANHAKAVATYLKTDHTEHYISPDDALAAIPLMGSIYCEPFADASQIPTLLVSQIARKQVTVALSGDGGDELFGGYNRHFWGPRIWKKIALLPRSLRAIGGRLARLLSPKRWDQFLGSFLRQTNLPGEKIWKVAKVAHSQTRIQMYHLLTSNISNPKSILIAGDEPQDRVTRGNPSTSDWDFLEQMLYLDSITYLPNDILTKVDRASMSVGLEARVPLLDHRMVEFAARLPTTMKLREGKGKWILKEVVHRMVPKELMARPKMGFRVPVSSWLRGPLKGWMNELLDRDRIADEGYFHPSAVRNLVDRHLSGREQCEMPLWSLLMFQQWLGTAA